MSIADFFVVKREYKLEGTTFQRMSPFGNVFITINHDVNYYPFEVFINIGKAGSDIRADAEAIGRLISLILRSVDKSARFEALIQIIDQLEGIGGASSNGFGPKKVLSLPDTVANVIKEYLEVAQLQAEVVEETRLDIEQQVNEHFSEAMLDVGEAMAAPQVVSSNGSGQAVALVGANIDNADMCPECGTYALVREEGCQHCLVCEYSKC